MFIGEVQAVASEGSRVDEQSEVKSTAFQKKLPFLKLDEIEDKEAFLLQLKIESKGICNKFAALVGYTEGEFNKLGITVQQLIIVIENMSMLNNDANELINKLTMLNDVTRAFHVMKEYWSFFDYELLATIIQSQKRNHSDLIAELDEYEAHFGEFCKRRLCEIPVEDFSEKASHNKVHIKVDEVFNIKGNGVKALTNMLSKLLDTNIRLVGVKEGCIELVYICMHELNAVFPLSTEQRQQVKEISQIRVLKIYSERGIHYGE